MRDVSIVMAFRAANEYRITNLLNNLKYLTGIFTQERPEIIVVDQDNHKGSDRPMPVEDADLHTVHYHRLPHAGPFNKAWALNYGVRKSTRTMLMFIDADMVATPNVYRHSAAILREGTVKALHMYRSFINTSQADSDGFKRALDQAPQNPNATEAWIAHLQSIATPATGEYAVDRTRLDPHSPLFGGMTTLTREAFDRVGGCEESFEGWGGEDDAMSFKLQHLVSTASLNTDHVVHLWHPPAEGALLRGTPHEKNRKTYRNFIRQFMNANGTVQLEKLKSHCQKQALSYGMASLPKRTRHPLLSIVDAMQTAVQKPTGRLRKRRGQGNPLYI